MNQTPFSSFSSPPPPEGCLAISQLNKVVEKNFEFEPLFQSLWIVGEITYLKYYSFGKLTYLTLSDQTSQLSCIVFDRLAKNIHCKLSPGLKIICQGQLRYYSKKGTVSFHIQTIYPGGSGSLSSQFEKLKHALSKEGLFDQKHKKEIPRFPQRIGLITATNAAGFVDYISGTKKFFPHIAHVLCPAIMQGPRCPESIQNALSQLSTLTPSVDLILLLRGGGAPEDLMCFNDEKLVRTLWATHLPIMTAIGHEIDFTLCDFIADHRAATPTAAVSTLATPYLETTQHIHSLIKRGRTQLAHQLDRLLTQTHHLLSRGQTSIHTPFNHIQQQMAHIHHRLERANPLHRFQQGFSITTDQNRNVISSIQDVAENDLIYIQYIDGLLSATINKKKPHDLRKKIKDA